VTSGWLSLDNGRIFSSTEATAAQLRDYRGLTLAAAGGDIVSVLDRSGRVRRWLVEGLHTFDFPWLNRAGPLWHMLLLIGTSCGFVLGCTGAVLGYRRLRGARR
jgi:hypothetical protein